ncbi:MAG: hypothetical protein KTR21_18000 [Rhodobacteraceae bacterium]|nr:hypothetical protein [Paracoccaceae bacterium]
MADIPDDISTTALITPSETIASEIENVDNPETNTVEVDLDWYRAELQEGLTYRVILSGDGTAGELSDVQLTIRDENGDPLLTSSADNDGIEALGFFTPSTGTYFIEAAGDDNGDLGTYRLTLVGDEFEATIDTVGTFAIGDTLQSAIEAEGDQDWFKGELQAGFTYGLKIEGDGRPGELTDVEVIAYDADGNPLASSGADADGQATLPFRPTEDGAYFIGAAGDDNADIGRYQLTILGDNFSQDTLTTGAFTFGVALNDSIEAGGDQDWYKGELQIGLTYGIILEGDGEPGELADVEAIVYDSGGNPLASSASGTDGLTRLSFTPTSSGTYFIAAAGDTTSDTGGYHLRVLNDVYERNVMTSGRFIPGGEIVSEIEAGGDQDWFKGELRAGYSYSFLLEGDSAPDALEDVRLILRGADGLEILDSGADNDGRATLTYTPTNDGVYFISVAGDDAADIGGYRLSIIDDEAPGSSATTRTLPPGESLTGAISVEGEEDWTELRLQADFTYGLMIEGDGSATELEDVKLRLLDRNGLELAATEDDDDGVEILSYTPASAGVYFVGAQGDDAADLGGYKLSLIEDDFAASTRTTGEVALNRAAAASHETAQDADWFRYALTAGDYSVTVASVDGDTSRSVTIGYADSSGAIRSQTTRDLDRAANFTIDDGEQNGYIVIDAGGEGTGSYAVTILANTDPIVSNGDEGDVLTGDGGDNVLTGGLGDDTLNGEGGRDFLQGEAGQDQLNGGDGDDNLLGGEGDDALNGGAGDDILTGDAGADALIGGEGYDIADFSIESGSGGLAINMNSGRVRDTHGGQDSFTSIEGVIGTNNADVIFGNGAGNELRGLDGADSLNGKAGDDSIFGGEGADRVVGGAGDDDLQGGGGDDVIGGRIGDDVIDAGAGDDSVVGQLGDDEILGGAGNDTLNGGSGVDILSGQDGDDVLLGRAGADTLTGGSGDDALNGGTGADVLNGGLGDDQLIGGADGDLFVFDQTSFGADELVRFASGSDVIQISKAVAANFTDLTLSETDDGVLVEFGGGSVLIADRTLDQIAESDFMFE